MQQTYLLDRTDVKIMEAGIDLARRKATILSERP